MTDTVARFRSGKIIFETVVDLENAIKLKHGENVDINDVIRDVAVYTDQKKGMRAGNAELKNVFGTTELQKVVEQIVKKGNIEVIQEFRDEKLEAKRKQVIDFLSRNAIDVRTGRPFTPDIIEKAIKEAKVNVQDKPLERQMPDIIETSHVICMTCLFLVKSSKIMQLVELNLVVCVLFHHELIVRELMLLGELGY